MLAYYAWNDATLAERLGIEKIGDGLRDEYNVADAPMPERLAALIGELERSEKVAALTVAENCLRPFDLLDDVIRRWAIRLSTNNTDAAPNRC